MAIEPGAMPSNEKFTLKGPDTCAPTQYALYSYRQEYLSCPYKIAEYTGKPGFGEPTKPIVRSVKVEFFEAFIELWTMDDRRLISDSRVHVDCQDNNRYEPVGEKAAIVDQCFDAVAEAAIAELERLFAGR